MKIRLRHACNSLHHSQNTIKRTFIVGDILYFLIIAFRG
jgi:hypothetical protein